MATKPTRRPMTLFQFWFSVYFAAATVPLFMSFVFLFFTLDSRAREPAIEELRHALHMTFMLSFVVLAVLGGISAWYARRHGLFLPCACEHAATKSAAAP